MDSSSHRIEEIAHNLAAVQRGWEAFNAAGITVDAIRDGALEPVMESLDRGIVFDVTGLGIPGLGTYYGHRGVRQFWLDWFEVVGDVHTDILETRAVGDKVVSVCRQSGSGIASGAIVVWEFSIVFTMRDAKVVRMDMYADAEEARRAAGLGVAAAH